MPALPWVTRQPLEPDRTYVVMSSKLPLQRSRSIPGFMRDTLAIRCREFQRAGQSFYGSQCGLLRAEARCSIEREVGNPRASMTQ